MNAWQGSDAQAWCRDFAGSEGDSIADAFSTAELSAILETTKSDREFTSSTYSVPFAASENILNEDKVFFLSAEEAENSNYGFTDDNARIANYGNSASLWWLRSPSSDLANFAGCVDFGGSVSFNFTYSYWAARPAFNLNPDSVLFTSAAEGVKSQSGMDSGLTAVSDYTGNEWKLTLLDSSRSEFSIGTMAIEGDTLTVAYSGATTGDNEYISAVVTDENDEITYYGRLQSVAGADGTVQVTLPDGFDSTTDTLYIFNEQYNGDKATDYAGEPKEVSMTLVGGGLSGTGTAEDPYLIADADDLKAFRDLVNAGYRKICGKLMADIVLNEDLDQSKFNAEIVEAGSGRYEIEVTYNGSTEIPDFEQWTPIGNDQSYTGTFDGDGHTVSGIYINTSVGNQGLFGYCYGSTIKGLGVINSYIRGDNAVGGIVGCSYGTVENCYNTGMVVGDLQAGGIVGINAFDSIVRNCYNTGTVTGIEYVGGLAGDIKTSYVGDDGLVTNSFNAGTVSGNNHVGGVAGGTEIVGNVANCYYLNTSAPAGVGGGGGTATSLTAEQITGPSAVETMNLDGSVWVPGGNTDGWHYKGVSDDDETTGEYAYSLYLPQLSAFAENGHESIDIVRTGLPQVTEEDEDGGTITYYLIYNADQLALFADIVNGNLSDADKSIYTEGAAANAILAADIDMSGVSWAGISTSSLAYTGIFDGRGHTLSNLTGTEALFAYNAGTIKNVRLTNVSISRGGNNLGAVAGLNTGTIFNCVTSGTVTLTSGNSVGGIAGYNNSGTVAGCYSDCSVSGGNPGGLIGSNYGGGIVTSSVYLGAEERPIEGDNTHGNKTDVFYKDANDAWHKVNGAGGNTVTADSTAEEAVTSFNAYVRANNGYFLLSAEGEIYPVDLTGSGTADNPYLIYDADQLKTFRNIVNNTLTEEEAERYTANAGACGKLMADIVLNAELDQSKFALGDDGNVTYDGSTEIPDFEQWVPIGNDDTPYAGTFDGNSKTVSGIYINTSSNYQACLVLFLVER